MTMATDFLRENGIDYTALMGGDRWFMRDHSIEEFMVRDRYIQKFGFAILTDAMIEVLRRHNPIVEVGAGSAYWSYEMKKSGVDVIATEPFPERRGHYRPAEWKMFTEFEKLSGVRAAAMHPDRTLLTVWPDYERNWAFRTLQVFKGNKVIYVGEGPGGCTGNDNFHDLLQGEFEEIEDVPMPQFYGIHDSMTIWKRKGAKP